VSAVVTRAAVAYGVDKPLKIIDIELPELGPRDVRVQMAAVGICHSDLSMLNGTLQPRFPVIPGHEASGVVAAVGPKVNAVAVGQHVVLNWAPPCRRCWFCLHGEPWLCAAVEGVVSTPWGRLDGEQVYGLFGVGAFAEQVVVSERGVVPIPDELPLDVAALLGCAVLTGVGAVCNTARVRPGETVAVFGLGGIGLSAIAGARLAGASRIIAIDVRADKAALAEALGATDFVPGEGKVAAAIRALTDGRGVDHAFECVGRSETIRTAWQSARRGGQAVVVGVGPKTAEVSFNLLELFHFSRVLTSSVFGASDPERDIPALAAQLLAGRLNLDPLITRRIELAEADDAFARMREGSGARAVIRFGAGA
jgi:S-(hydroxymethyl)glutathione dehydrogenase/alcohol dehydrogenase